MARYITVDSTTGDENDVFVIDTDQERFAQVKYSELPDKDNVEFCGKNPYGTLAYINTEHKFYGIIVIKYINKQGLSPVLHWISIENFEKDYNKNGVYKCKELIDITADGQSIFNKYWFKGIKPLAVQTLSGKWVKQEELFKDTTVQQTQTPEEKPEAPEQKPEEHKAEEPRAEISEEKSEEPKAQNQSTDNTVNYVISTDYIKELATREANLKLREQEIESKLADITETENKVNQLLQSLENTEFQKATDVVIGVDKVYSGKVAEQESKIEISDMLYENTLKIIQEGDVVSLPKAFLSRVIVHLRKSLESNVSFTAYKALVCIKFEKGSRNNIFGVLDYNEDLEYAKFTVIRTYGIYNVSDSDITDYYLKYEQKRKKNMFLKG